MPEIHRYSLVRVTGYADFSCTGADAFFICMLYIGICCEYWVAVRARFSFLFFKSFLLTLVKEYDNMLLVNG